MSAPTLTYPQLIALRPCEDDRKSVEKLLGGKTKWNGKQITAAQAVAAGVSFGNLVWVASAIALTDKDVERRLRLWMADCAARVLHIYEKEAPTDMRVRNCIIVSRQFARGEVDDAARDAARAAARDAAWAAARDAAWAAAWDAARAAARDAAWAAARDAARAAARDAARAAARAAARDTAWDAARAAAWDAARAAARDAARAAARDAARAAARDAAWAAARDAARAAARAAARDTAWDAAWAAAWAAEEKWQLERLVAWLSDPEPADLELPALQTAKTEAA